MILFRRAKHDLKKIKLVVLALWTALLLGLVLYGVYLHQRNIETIARNIAVNTLNVEIAHRYWIAQCGGVYVTAASGITPNPYLAGIKNRDIETGSGLKLTLVNPAYMTRLVNEMGNGQYGTTVHITSLKLLRPENRPDAWEKEALLALSGGSGKSEVSVISPVAGKLYLRFMRKLLVEKKCLKCHARQGYKVGDVRGGLVANVLLKPLRDSLASQLQSQLLLYLLIYSLGLGGILVVFVYLGNSKFRLDEQNRGLAALSNSTFLGIGRVTGRVMNEVNDRFCELFGYSREELIGKNTRFLYLGPDEYERVAELYQSEKSIEVRMLRKDGTIIDLLLAATNLDQQDLSVGTLFTMIDISVRKQVQRQLRMSESRFRGMIEAIPDPVYIGAPGRKVEYLNPAMIARIGRDATGEVCYSAIHGLDAVCPWCENLVEPDSANIDKVIKSPLDSRYCVISRSPFTAGLYPETRLVLVRDVTALEEMRIQLQQSQKMEAIGTLAGGVAHDFNNILTVIRGHAEMGLMQAAADSPEFIDFTAIEMASSRAKSLTSQLLAFSRKQMIKPQIVMVDKLLSELNKMLRRLIGEDISFSTHFTGILEPIFIDPGQFDQVVINLVINAVDAVKAKTENLEKVITISAAMIFLDSSFVTTHEGSRVGQYLLLEVADTGSGMADEIKEHIFEPFYTTKERGQGTGLGLSMVYGIVKQNHGYIEVVSEPDEGAAFKIFWPVVEESATAEDLPASIPARLQVRGETIMIVEDDEDVRSIARDYLQDVGYKVITAENGCDALAKIKSLEVVPDLLFTDVVMPEMNGHELGERVADLYPDMEIIYTSGYFDNRIWPEGAGPDTDRFITKPYELDELLMKIKNLLAG